MMVEIALAKLWISVTIWDFQVDPQSPHIIVMCM